jgi:hypothetical protein
MGRDRPTRRRDAGNVPKRLKNAQKATKADRRGANRSGRQSRKTLNPMGGSGLRMEWPCPARSAGRRAGGRRRNARKETVGWIVHFEKCGGWILKSDSPMREGAAIIRNFHGMETFWTIFPRHGKSYPRCGKNRPDFSMAWKIFSIAWKKFSTLWKFRIFWGRQRRSGVWRSLPRETTWRGGLW